MKRLIPYGRQDINEEDIQAVINVLRSDFLTQGPVIPAFEAAIAKYCGAKYAVAVNSATSALHLACLALGVGKDDFVWTSPITFVASANCALYCGAQIDFVDIDSHSYNMSLRNLSEKLIHAEKVGKLPKVVIAVHLCGQSCEMAGIFDLSRQYGFKIIEDASHAIGGKYQDKAIGSCRFSDITIFSFHPVKIITTGEGGMAVTNDVALSKRMQLLRSHGITRNENEMIQISEGSWYYQQIELGFNYRMTDIQAALGLSQLYRLDEFVAKRQLIANQYDKKLANLPVITPRHQDTCYSAFHLYVIRLKLNEMTQTHRQVFEFLREKGVSVNLHYIPVHMHPYYKRLGFNQGDFPIAESYYENAISLPIFPALTNEQQEYIIEVIKTALNTGN